MNKKPKKHSKPALKAKPTLKKIPATKKEVKIASEKVMKKFSRAIKKLASR